MIFGHNSLRLVNGSGDGIEFTALDALKRVDTQHDTVQVANAKQWKEARLCLLIGSAHGFVISSIFR